MNIIRELGALMYPWPLECRSCGNNTGGEYVLCAGCRSMLDAEEPLTGFGVDTFGISAAAHRYNGAAREMVTSLKYNSFSVLARDMVSDMLCAADSAGISQPDVIAYVPMHARRRREKYFDQAEVLAKLAAKHWDMQRSKALTRVREGEQQARIRDAEARARNVKDAFSASPEVYGKRVLLIDDVYTTGATSKECARTLIDAGAASVDLLVYAFAGGSMGA